MIDELFCAEMCRQSYYEPAGEDFVDVDGDGHDLRYGVRERGGVTYIAFRGSSSLLNWRRNMRFIPTLTESRFVAHRGFVEGFHFLDDEIPDWIGKVVFTGHSLGGALATLFAEAYGAPLVTFGAPRVYLRWGATPKIEHYRFVCDDDPVPMVPRLLYRHLEEPIVLPDVDGRRIHWRDHGIAVYIDRIIRRLEAA